MNFLTVENEAYDIANLPDEVDDFRYCTFDVGVDGHMDYYFTPLVFLESWQYPAAVLQIGEYKVQVPLDWSILVCDEDYTTVELVQVSDLNDRGFCTLVYNPYVPSIPSLCEVSVVNVFSEVRWFFPKVANNSLLVVPVDNCTAPPCVLLASDKVKFPTDVGISDLF